MAQGAQRGQRPSICYRLGVLIGVPPLASSRIKRQKKKISSSSGGNSEMQTEISPSRIAFIWGQEAHRPSAKQKAKAQLLFFP